MLLEELETTSLYFFFSAEVSIRSTRKQFLCSAGVSEEPRGGIRVVLIISARRSLWKLAMFLFQLELLTFPVKVLTQTLELVCPRRPTTVHVCIRTVSSYRILSTLIQFELVYGPFKQRNIHSILYVCPRPARKEMSVPLHK